MFIVSSDYPHISRHHSRIQNLDGMAGNTTLLPTLVLLFETFLSQETQPREDRKLRSLRLSVLISIAGEIIRQNSKAVLGRDGRAISYRILDGSKQATIALHHLRTLRNGQLNKKEQLMK